MLKKIKYFAISIFILLSFGLNAEAQSIAEKNVSKSNSLPPKNPFAKSSSANSTFAIDVFSNFAAAARNQNYAFERGQLPDSLTNNANKNDLAFDNNSQLYLKSYLVSDSEIKYGATLKLESEVFSDKIKGAIDVDEGFVYAESDFGKVEFGNNVPVNQTMKAGPTRFARGDGGINGNYLKYINFPMLANSASGACSGGTLSSACSTVKLPRFILIPQSPIGHGGYAQGFYSNGSSNAYRSDLDNYNSFNKNRAKMLRDGSFNGAEDAAKITYYSPRISALQFGFSFTPDSSDNGISSTVFSNDEIKLTNIISFGVNYSDNLDNLGYAISLTGEKGKYKKSSGAAAVERNDLSAYDASITLAYFGFNFGASFGSWGNSLQPKSGIYSCDYNSGLPLADQQCSSNAKKFNDATYKTLGISYQIGHLGASITNLSSQFQKNKYQATSFGLDYKLARDLMPYTEITRFKFKSNQANASDISANPIDPKNNQGFVFLVGVLLAF